MMPLRILSAYLQGFNASYSCVSCSSEAQWQHANVRRSHIGIYVQICIWQHGRWLLGRADRRGVLAVVDEPPHGWRQRSMHLGGQRRVRPRQLLQALY
jgi:hypothetical protein